MLKHILKYKSELKIKHADVLQETTPSKHLFDFSSAHRLSLVLATLETNLIIYHQNKSFDLD